MDSKPGTTLSALQAERDALIASFPEVKPRGGSSESPVKTLHVNQDHQKDTEPKTAAVVTEAGIGSPSSEPASKSKNPKSESSFLASTAADTKAASDTAERERVLSEADRVVKNHIRLLNSYNEIRDVGQSLLALIAEQRGVPLADVMEEFEVKAGD